MKAKNSLILFFAFLLVMFISVGSFSASRNISILSFLDFLQNTFPTENNDSIIGSKDLFKRFYDLPKELIDFEVSGDWGAFNFLRDAISFIVRCLAVVLDFGNYIVWFLQFVYICLTVFFRFVGFFLGF